MCVIVCINERYDCAIEKCKFYLIFAPGYVTSYLVLVNLKPELFELHFHTCQDLLSCNHTLS